jgi:hypothetical protein
MTGAFSEAGTVEDFFSLAMVYLRCILFVDLIPYTYSFKSANTHTPAPPPDAFLFSFFLFMMEGGEKP